MKHFFSAVCIFFLMLPLFSPSLQGAAAGNQKKITAIRANGKRYFSLKDIGNFYGMRFYQAGSYCAVYDRYRSAFFVFEKRDGTINQTAVTWSAAPLIAGGQVFISEYDFFKMLDPVFRYHLLPRKAVRTIVLDPGHGGQDKGASSILPGKEEKQANLALALKLRKLLAAKGYQVYLTRTGDKQVPLQKRPVMAGLVKPDLFISIHCNAVKNPAVSGIETFAATPEGMPSSGDVKPNTAPGPGNAFDRQSYLLAHDIQTSLARTTGLSDRGVKHARYYVIRNAPCPAVLIEAGFVSNKRDSQILFSEAGQNAIVNAILRGIQTYAVAVR